MNIQRMTRRLVRRANLVFGLVLSFTAGFAIGDAAADPDLVFDGFERFVDAKGDFVSDPRKASEGLTHLGSFFVPMGDAAGFHHVYTQPGVPEAWRRDGVFPDGTVLVKEIATHRVAHYTTGRDVASATEARQWFVMIKNGRGRFEGHPLWGEGWGWALFRSDAPTHNVAQDFKLDCLGCHAPARPNDWVYVEGYPALRGSERPAGGEDQKTTSEQ